MRKSKYTKEILEPIVKSSHSYSEVLTKLGVKQSGGMHRLITHRVKLLEIDDSHFTGSAWSKGLTREIDSRVNAISKKNSFSDEQVFVENSPLTGGQKLTKRLIRLGWEYTCKVCGLNKWQSRPLTLHLDHINGNHNDNRLENLRFLCPNCHQQTATWGAKNKTY